MSTRRYSTVLVVCLAVGTLARPARADDLLVQVASGALKITRDSDGITVTNTTDVGSRTIDPGKGTDTGNAP